MGAVLDNAILLPDGDDPIDWHITPSILGAAADNAISGRSDGVRAQRTFVASASDITATKAAISTVGDRIYRSDLKTVEELQAGGWKVIHTYEGVAFTPAWNELNSAVRITIGNGTQSWFYWVNQKMVYVQGVVIFGSTTTIGTSTVGMRLPLAPGLPPRLLSEESGLLGDAYADVGARAYRGLVTSVPDVLFANDPWPLITFRAGAAVLQRGMTTTHPGNWSSGATLSVNYSYETT